MNLSLIIPTLNESKNIGKLLERIQDTVPEVLRLQVVIVDDGSTDGTESAVNEFISNGGNRLDIVFHRRVHKRGLGSAILDGIAIAKNRLVIVMDADMSHPPEMIEQMARHLDEGNSLVIASRYVGGGKTKNWPLKRKIISKSATLIAKFGLKIKQKDPMSGYFGLDKNITKGIDFDAIGYKLLLEILVKIRDIKVIEIPFTFTDRSTGHSKMKGRAVLDFIKSVWQLYRYGRAQKENRASVRFFSKAARFFTVGASGLVINLSVIALLTETVSLNYLFANSIGILTSMTNNFLLNKVWTFQDRRFERVYVLKQYGKFVSFSSGGAILQLTLIYYFVDLHHLSYYPALIMAVMIAAFGNFILNKRFTFGEKIWS